MLSCWSPNLTASCSYHSKTSNREHDGPSRRGVLGTQFALAAAPERSLEPGENVAALLSVWCPPSCILNLIKAKPGCPLCCSVVSGFLAGAQARQKRTRLRTGVSCRGHSSGHCSVAFEQPLQVMCGVRHWKFWRLEGPSSRALGSGRSRALDPLCLATLSGWVPVSPDSLAELLRLS